MYPFFVALHVLLCLFLIVVILLQPGKGGDIGAAFGGGGSTMFGPRGPTGILQQATTVVAVLFMGTTLTLALYSNRGMMADADVEEELRRLEQQEQLEDGGGLLMPDALKTPAPSDPGVVTP